MNKIVKRTLLASAVFLASAPAFAGNGDRIGSAGATELLINPWARSAAWADASVACGTGLDAVYTNIAGLAFTDKTQIRFDRTNWLGGSGIGINSAGLAQRISDNSVISVTVMAMTFGDIDITTVDLPEGGIGTFSPTYSNFNVGYAREFTNSIYGGINFKVVNEAIANLRGTSVALDAGIRYVTGEEDQIKFGITLKNIGPTMTFKGDGMAIQIMYPNTGELATLEQRAASFEMPSTLNIGGSYDFNFGEMHKLTTAFAFSANSFSHDQYRLGVNYGMDANKMAFNVMAGYTFEKGLFSSDGFVYGGRVTALSGLSAGVSVDGIVGKNKHRLGVQYSYRHANPFNGIHTIGLSIDMK
ncbi:PorV/PorQ family protein [Paracrocinitomix mangrovi]|uniref:PorV/PorQ family protein n=1 Tax=Paracrocinitomix mangrovi TaxID=2862509 RepID=UPI001C8E975A|nr:PorV/PorQ family protein [Paracrocinitomix mangrovi]UKN03565.1 PorV/PorQ family protein [Paracrocinitomix mangrovi]